MSDGAEPPASVEKSGGESEVPPADPAAGLEPVWQSETLGRLRAHMRKVNAENPNRRPSL